jgi:hypothetical protein
MGMYQGARPIAVERRLVCRHPVWLKETAEQGRACFVEAVFVEAGGLHTERCCGDAGFNAEDAKAERKGR